LRPQDAPAFDDLVLDLNAQGIGPGVWYYRVSAVMAAHDADNPSGETLPGDPIPVRGPQGLPSPLKAAVLWKAVPGAAGYRVYRSPTPDLAQGNERLLAVVNGGGVTSYTDLGGAAGNEIPRQIGDLGTFRALPSLPVAVEGAGLTTAKDPVTPN